MGENIQRMAQYSFLVVLRFKCSASKKRKEGKEEPKVRYVSQGTPVCWECAGMRSRHS